MTAARISTYCATEGGNIALTEFAALGKQIECHNTFARNRVKKPTTRQIPGLFGSARLETQALTSEARARHRSWGARRWRRCGYRDRLRADELSQLRMSVRCIHAVIHARMTFTQADGRSGPGRYTDIWARRNGEWRAVAAHVTRL